MIYNSRQERQDRNLLIILCITYSMYSDVDFVHVYISFLILSRIINRLKCVLLKDYCFL